MTVGIAGSGPAVEAIEQALSDVDAGSERQEALDVGAYDLGVVVDLAGSAVFDRVDEVARDAETPWIAVELGGVGGVPVVEAAVTGFDVESPCYACLRTRVRSNVDPTEQPTEAPPPATARFAGAIAGRAAAGFVDDDGAPDVFGRVTEIPHARRRLLPVPGCECGSAPARRINRTHLERDLDESLALAEQGLDERLGIVQEVGEVESFPLPYYLARIGETDGFSDASAASQAAGAAADWNTALMKGLGEAYERYAAGVYRASALTEGTVDEMETAVPPSSFVTPNPPERAASRHWIDGENLATGQDVNLPASLAVYPPPDETIRPGTTTGLGLGDGTVGAMLSGLYEVIERDAAMLAWYSTFEPLELVIDEPEFATLADRLASEGLAVTPLLLTQDVDVPVVGCAVHRAGGEWPRFAMGSGAALDPSAAARSALGEAAQNWMEIRRMGPEGADEAGGAIGKYAGFPDVVASFVDAPSSVAAASVAPDEQPTGEAELREVIERIIAAGLTPYATRLTTRDLATLGFEAVRVLVPEAQPLFLGEPYFGDRLESVSERLGFEPRPDRSFHPFP